ncbi:MAG: ABC transporter permease [Candidatus Cloacimonetes bacterium]|nr:ABC transporter permease [Candidatus Cloacimonadota bacterium]
MKNLSIFVRKEFLHIVRDPKSLMIMVLLPLVEIMLIGFVLRFEIANTNLAVVDMAKQQQSTKLIHRLEGGDRFKVRLTQSMPEAEELLTEGKVKAILYISEDFDRKAVENSESSLQLLLDATDPNIATTIEAYVKATLADFWVDSIGGSPVPMLITEQMFYYNPLLKSVYATVPGLISVVLMLICALMTSISLTREKESGTLKVLLISPLKPLQIIIGKLAPYLLVSLLITGIILALSFGVFGVPMAGSLIMLIMVSFVYCLCALALGFLISTKAKTQQVAMMMSLAGLMLPTTLLSGMIYPIKNMPLWLQGITYIMPARWFVSILKHIMLKASPFSAYAGELVVLLIMTGIFTLLSLKNFTTRFR